MSELQSNQRLIAQLRYEITEDIAYDRYMREYTSRFKLDLNNLKPNVKLVFLGRLLNQTINLRDCANNLDFDNRYDEYDVKGRYILGDLLVLASQQFVSEMIDDPEYTPDQYMLYISDIEQEVNGDFFANLDMAVNAAFNNVVSFLFGNIIKGNPIISMEDTFNDAEYGEILELVETVLCAIIAILRNETNDLIDIFRIYNEYECVMTCKWEVDHLIIQLYADPTATMPEFLKQRLNYDW